jgi:hypothetical protein
VEVNKIYQVINSDTPNIVKKYMDINAGLQIDLGDDPNYFVDLDADDNLIIKDLRTFRPAMKITPFFCDWEVDSKNC